MQEDMKYFLREVASKLLLVGTSVLPFSPMIASDDIQVESTTIFNTTCARCHEGECSGRLSFHMPKSAADQHILRYGGELSSEQIRQLFELLRFMKEECGFYPITAGFGADGRWDSEELDELKSPSNQSYFVPLGSLEPGFYQLLLEGLNDSPDSCIEIINDEFEYYEKQKVNGKIGRTVLQFYSDIYSGYYLRITARKPLALKRIELQASEKSGANN